MKVNGIDIRKYNAKQLTVEVQPPSIAVNYEWLDSANVPTEFNTDIKMGHIKVSVYFKGKDRTSILRMASEFMENFTKSCDLELDNYRGRYRGFMTSNDYEKMSVKNRYIVNLELDGYFYDDEIEIVLDEKTETTVYRVGTRDAPCILSVTAKKKLTDFSISGFGEDDIIIKSLEKGATIEVNGSTGLVTKNRLNAFESIDLWELPELKEVTRVTLSSQDATVTIRYAPMWI